MPLRRPGAGVGRLRVVVLLQVGTPDVDVAGDPIVAVADALEGHDRKAVLASYQRTGDGEAQPGCCQRHQRGLCQGGCIGFGDVRQQDLPCLGGEWAQMQKV